MNLAPVSARQAYGAGLARFPVTDGGRLSATRMRCTVKDAATGRTVFVGDRRDAHRQRRLKAAEHAADTLNCLDALDRDMKGSPVDGTWIKRLREACMASGVVEPGRNRVWRVRLHKGHGGAVDLGLVDGMHRTGALAAAKDLWPDHAAMLSVQPKVARAAAA